jgi:O-antigen ligase
LIGYANFLYATSWRKRLIFGVATLFCLLALYFSLENSWWLEVAIGLMLITGMFSRRLVLFFLVCAMPLLPLIKAEIDKLQQVKTADFYRLIIWRDALRVWSKQPIFGVGAGDFWTYDQHFTQLPMDLHDCNKTGLCVAHNGYLQLLGELGPMGVILILCFIVVIIVIGVMLYRRSKVQMRPGGTILDKLDLGLYADTPQRYNRILAVICIGLVCGSAVGDFFSGSFFLQPRQVGSSQGLPQVITSWIMWGCLIYRDKLWRMAREKVVPNQEEKELLGLETNEVGA